MSFKYTSQTSGITVNELPSISNSAYNPIWFSWSSAVSGSTAIKPTLIITISDNFGADLISQGDELIINDILYQAKNSPTWGEFQTGTEETAAQSLYHALFDDVNLNYKYDILYDQAIPNQIQLQSKVKSPVFNFTVSANWSGCTLDVYNTATPRRDQLYENWSIIMQMYKNNVKWGNPSNYFLNDSEFIVSLERQYQKDNIYNFNVESIYNKLVDTEEPNGAPYQAVDGWETCINYKLLEAYATGTNLYKTKYLVGEGYNHWVFNVAKELGTTFNITDYTSFGVPFSVSITFNLGLVSGNTIDISGPVTMTYTMTTTPVNVVVLGNEATQFVNQFNALTTDYVASNGTNGNIVNIVATSNGPAYDLFFNPNSQWFGLSATSGVNPSQCLPLTTRNTVRGGLGDKMLAYFYIPKLNYYPYVAIKKVATLFDNTTETIYENFYQISQYGLQKLEFTIGDNWTSKPKYVTWNVVIKPSLNASVDNWTIGKKHYIIENEEVNEESDVCLVWQNSLGVFESYTFRGYTTESYTTDKITYNKWRNKDWTKQDGSLKVVSTSSRKTQNIRSYWVTYEEMVFLKEMLSSTKVFKWNDNYEYVVIDSHTWEVDRQLDLYKLDFTLVNSIEENYVK